MAEKECEGPKEQCSPSDDERQQSAGRSKGASDNDTESDEEADEVNQICSQESKDIATSNGTTKETCEKRMLSPSPTTELMRRFPCKSSKKCHGDIAKTETKPNCNEGALRNTHPNECEIFRKVLQEVAGGGCSSSSCAADDDGSKDKFVPISAPSDNQRITESSTITCTGSKPSVCDQMKNALSELDRELTNAETENPFKSNCPVHDAEDHHYHQPVTLHFNNLPMLLKSQIFSYLTMNELLCTASLVCRTWYEAAREPGLWRRLLLDRPAMVDDDLLNVVGINANLSQLHILDCRKLSGVAVDKALAGCPTLKELVIMRCSQLKADAFSDIGEHCPLLTKVNFSNSNGVPDVALEKIASHCPHLCELRLNRCNLLTDESITQVVRGCPKLKVLTFQENHQITDVSLKELCTYSHNLEVLSLHKCAITNQGIMDLHKLTKLRNLDLSNLSNLSSNSVGDVVSQMPQLDTLNLCLSRNISDSCLQRIAASCKKLKYVFLVSCNITDEGLIHIGRHSRSIEHLDVGWCEDITDTGATAISQMCPQLKYLGMVRCDQITEACVTRLVKEFPHIHYSTFLLDSQRLLEKAKQQGYQLNI